MNSTNKDKTQNVGQQLLKDITRRSGIRDDIAVNLNDLYIQ
jgi:hypothetical protein